MSSSSKVVLFAWGSSALAATLGVLAWGQSIGWSLSEKRPLAYQLFPLLGLLAFGLMWAHYVTSTFRSMLQVPRGVLKTYLETTSLAVLIAILLHPGLLWMQLWRDGFGLPPNSYLEHYVAPSLRWAAMLGTVSWLAFLAYELRRKYVTKDWWKYIRFASDLAMIAIFVHGLKLGQNLQTGWFVYVWYGYGLTLFGSLAYMYKQYFDKRHRVD